MTPSSPQFSRFLVLIVWTVVVLVFAWIYARDSQPGRRPWVLGWLAIEVHFAAGLLGSLWLGGITLLMAACAFFLCLKPEIGKRQTVFWSLLFAPAAAYLTLAVLGYQPHWAYAALLVTITAGAGWLAAAHRSVRAPTMAGWLILGAAPTIVVLSLPFEISRGMDLILFQAFAATGCAYWFRFRRLSPGVVLTSLSFICWGILGTGAGVDSVILDIPKYLVAFGMVITLYEEQTNVLKAQMGERRQTEDALRLSDHWLRESQRVSHIGSYAVNIATGVWKGSQTVDEIFGIGPEARHIATWEQAILPEYREQMAAYLRTGGQEREQPFDRECVIQRISDGEERWVQWRGALIHDARGNVPILTGTIQDITEQKNIQKQLQQARKMESIGRLAGGVAHDFNNLLTVINGYSDLLLKRMEFRDPLRNKVSEIRDAGARAAELTYQLLAFSRRQFLQPRVLDLNSTVAETERLLRRLIGDNIRVSTILSPTLGMVEADPGQINQVLLNLAINARDAMTDGGTIIIETANVDQPVLGAAPRADSRPGSFVRVSITDTGVGMDQETQTHLFEPFFTTKPRGQGTGLGLSTVYGIVKQSGGAVRVQSEAGRGTTFEVYLPCVQAAVPVQAGSPSAPVVESGAETILIAEDQSGVRNLICSILESSGYRTLAAASGEEALELSRAFPGEIGLLITDVVMPGMSGQTLVEQLALSRPEAAAILMSGYTEDVLAHHNADRELAFLHKPFTPDALRGMVATVLKNQAAAKTGVPVP